VFGAGGFAVAVGASMIRVVLVDDHPVVRTGFKRLLEQTGQIEVLGDYADPAQALAASRQQVPDVWVLDLSLGQVHGLDWLGTLLHEQPQAKVLVFSMHDGPALVKRALSLGAAGFVSKQSQPDSLVDAVLAVHRGERYLSADLVKQVRVNLDPHEALLASLSPRELEVFRCLAQGLSVGASAEKLGLSAKTVSNHQTILKEKLQVQTTAGLVHLALKHQLWPGDFV
jgi:DNA-binding NarL/FixJ family response regulator